MAKILVVIGCRGGSKGVKGKNVRSLMGKPLIAYTIAQALAWGKAKRVVVSTDSREIAEIARAYGAEVPFMRPKIMATATASKGPAIKHALIECQRIYKEKYDVVVDLDVTCPIRTTKDLDNCLKIFQKYHPKTIFSVVHAHKNPYFNMVEKINGKIQLSKKPEKYIYRRQDCPPVYSMNAAIYFFRSDYVLEGEYPRPFSDDTKIYVMDDIAAVDIDREVDFKYIEFLAKEGVVNLGQTQPAKNYLDKFSLKGKTIFVCGGAGLIGAEVARAVASCGARTVILDVNKTKAGELIKELSLAGGEVCFESFDVTKIEKIESTLKILAQKYNRLDGWINLSYPRTSDWGNKVEDLKVNSLRKNVDTQLNSAIWATRAVALIMKKQKIHGSIVNLGSTYGVQGNDFTIYEGTKMTSPMAYAAIKGGIINLTRYMASYFGSAQVRINNLCPGGIQTKEHNPRFVKNYEKKTPLKRMGHPEDIASAAIFLLSDASAYVTGETLMVDGGWTNV